MAGSKPADYGLGRPRFDGFGSGSGRRVEGHAGSSDSHSYPLRPGGELEVTGEVGQLFDFRR